MSYNLTQYAARYQLIPKRSGAVWTYLPPAFGTKKVERNIKRRENTFSSLWLVVDDMLFFYPTVVVAKLSDAWSAYGAGSLHSPRGRVARSI